MEKADGVLRDAYLRRLKKAHDDGALSGELGALQWVVRLIAEARVGELDARAAARLECAKDTERLYKLVVDLSTAPDAAAVQTVLNGLDT